MTEKNENIKDGVKLVLTITVDETMRRLNSHMDKYKPFWQFRCHGDKDYVGQIEGESFVISKARFDRMGIPTLEGRITSLDSGGIVEIKPKSQTFLKIFIVLGIVCASAFLFYGVHHLYKSFSSGTVDGADFMVFLMPVLFTTVGTVIFYYDLKSFKKEESLLVDMLKNLLSEFDYQKFESLTGFELGIYCYKDVYPEMIDERFLEYFKQNCDAMEDAHLEAGLCLLEKSKMKAAYPVVANYIDHSLTSIRMPAIRFLTQWLNNYDVDETVLMDSVIMEKVEKTLRDHGDLMGVKQLNYIVKRKQKMIRLDPGSSPG